MSDNQIKSKKISLKKQFKIVWIVLAVILVCNIIISLISYSSYKKGQDLTAASLIVSDAITGTGKFTSEKLEKDRKGTIRSMYSYLNPSYYSYRSSYGTISNSDVISAVRKVESSLNEILRGEKYNKGASYYLKYTSFGEFYSNTNTAFFIIYGILFLIVGTLNLYYLIDRKTEIVIKNELLICKRNNGKSIQALLENINSVETTRLKGLSLIGNGFKYKIILVENNEVLREEIMKLLSKISKVEHKKEDNYDSMKELKKYKKLLDDGIITEEEFDKKKKELLNL